jgi:hypothetical protein
VVVVIVEGDIVSITTDTTLVDCPDKADKDVNASNRQTKILMLPTAERCR